MKKISLITLSLLVYPFFAFAENPNTVAILKAEIINLARLNTSNDLNRPEIRQELNQLINDLTQQTPPVTEMDWMTYSPGSWRQTWSDEADNSPAGSPPRDLEKIFQHVTAQGRAVNFGERILSETQRVTFALEAVGSVLGNKQTTEILKAFSRPKGLSADEKIETLALDILNEELIEFSPVQAGEFPKGPIKAKSDLTLLYLDENLKIGTAPNVYSGFIELFILEKVTTVQ